MKTSHHGLLGASDLRLEAAKVRHLGNVAGGEVEGAPWGEKSVGAGSDREQVDVIPVVANLSVFGLSSVI